MDFSDVIVAPASGAGRCAVAVIRMSGKGSTSLAAMLCRDGRRQAVEIETDRRMRLVWLEHPASGRVLDQAMVVAYGSGASFTGEESVEFFCHGGPVIVDSVVRACVDVGARHAAPGEFTRRAVANGRLDLVQAEAVALLTESENETAADVGLGALRGESSAALGGMTARLLDILAELEASLDFEADDEVYVDLSGVGPGLAAAVSSMDSWIRDARAVRPAVSGFRVVLSGEPNAGKSTLFNAIAGAELAIVHHDPGTTRDVISERMVLAGTGCVLFDTAGLRTGAGDVEAEGVRRAMKAAREADLVLNVIDATRPDLTAPPPEGCRNVATVYSKIDLVSLPLPAQERSSGPVFAVSARTGAGMSELRDYIAGLAAAAVRSARATASVVAGERQVNALSMARGHAEYAASALASDAPLEVVAGSIRAAVEALGEITGSHITEQVLDRIFSRFCIGK
jgi:tRNA modification GTPase